MAKVYQSNVLNPSPLKQATLEKWEKNKCQLFGSILQWDIELQPEHTEFPSPRQETGNIRESIDQFTGHWVPLFHWIVKLVGGMPTPLKNMSLSVGMIIPNIWKNKVHDPKHQPVKSVGTKND